MAEKLLVIDDDVAITEVIGLIAKELGVECKAINTSLTATETFLDYRPDVVILDIVMPDKDGIDVLNEIMNTGISARIVLTSGCGNGYLRLAQGIAEFHRVERFRVLKKPFRHSELVGLLISNAPATVVTDPTV